MRGKKSRNIEAQNCRKRTQRKDNVVRAMILRTSKNCIERQIVVPTRNTLLYDQWRWDQPIVFHHGNIQTKTNSSSCSKNEDTRYSAVFTKKIKKTFDYSHQIELSALKLSGTCCRTLETTPSWRVKISVINTTPTSL